MYTQKQTAEPETNTHGSYVLEALNMPVPTDGTKYHAYGFMGWDLLVLGMSISLSKGRPALHIKKGRYHGIDGWMDERYACM